VKSVLPAVAAGLICSLSCPAHAEEAPAAASAEVERWRAAMGSARWTGPLLASNAESLPQGHAYTEPYFFDFMSGGNHSPGSAGFYQYGLLDSFTVGLQPNFAFATDKANRGMALGDLKILSQLRLTHFKASDRIPTVAIVLNEALPIGKYDHLGEKMHGHGSGAFATEVGVNVQHYFMLGNGRLLRGRINVLKSFPLRTDVAGRSIYGTGPDFRGHAKPGSKTTLVAAVEYSLTDEWVLAIDIQRDAWDKTRVVGREVSGGPLVEQTFPKSWNVGFSPAIEYNWSPRTGIILGVWIVPKGHNTRSSVTPAIAFSRFW
jgi:hypothetical protein